MNFLQKSGIFFFLWHWNERYRTMHALTLKNLQRCVQNLYEYGVHYDQDSWILTLPSNTYILYNACVI